MHKLKIKIKIIIIIIIILNFIKLLIIIIIIIIPSGGSSKCGHFSVSVGGVVASWLVCSTPKLVVQV